MELSPLPVMLLLVSLTPVAHAQGSPKAVISVKPDTHVFIGETVTLRCDVRRGGSTQWPYSWFQDNRRLYEYGGNSAITAQEIIIHADKNSDSGYYTCRGQYSEISVAVALTVSAKPKPTVRVNPQSSVYTGDTITLSCELQQSTGWEFLFYKNYQHLQPLSSETVSTNTQHVTVDNAGEAEYQCIARRYNVGAGTYYYTKYSDPVRITAAKPKPTVRVNPQSSVYTGDTITLSCELQQSTGWEFLWYKNYQQLQLLKSEQAHTQVTADNAGETVYQCRARWRNYNYYYTELSDPVKITVRERPRAALSVSPQSWLTEGDSVTLSCEVTDSSTDWTFSWYTTVPYRDGLTQIKNNRGYSMYVELLSDSSRGSGGSYTLSPAALHHTGVYMCRGERGEPAFHTQYSNPQPLWITGESPPFSLIINPNRTQHFSHDSLSLSCEDQSNSTGRTVRRCTHSERVLDCSWWGSVTGSTCKISFLSTSHTGVYWCESESGENSNLVNITVHDGDVILESPVHPVTEGHPLTLRCLYRNTKPLNLRADFYKDGSVLQTQTTGEMIIQTVSKSDEGFYHCKHPERGESLKSWLSVRREKPSSVSDSGSGGGTAGAAVGLGFLFIALLILMILLWSYKRKKGKQQKTNQTSEQNQSRSGAEDSQSGHTTLQAESEHIYATVDQADTSGTGEAAAESEATYSQVTKKKKTNRKNGADAEPGVSDVTYAEIQLKPMKKAKRMKEKSSMGDDIVYSELHQNIE
ncbi:leukocyte immunoglobulin-like receptor subfamily B member 2 isoform X2 [Pangasianodon hypophthalmus]|uniref:leukocyte immunoglobulin-like receptor subfamily B member 2 isoform X2 n=1 Tax=Pangasianodon hypophthalmus TaxID=310915 RepID=UPI002307F54D|nr:leukocyte immunoglobulin-like receptor subfamily B member 2 isoform X2 [Pangasianodon hypophthalmus]